MQEYRRAAFVLGAVFLPAALACSGCGQDPRSELAKTTERARRLYDKACSHLMDPVYKVEGKDAPLTSYRRDLNERAERILELDPNNPQDRVRRQKEVKAFPVEPAPAGAISPLADGAIQRAVDELSAALKAPGNATAVDVAQGRAVLARLYALRGFRWALAAARKRDEAWHLVRRLESAAIAMGDHGRRIATCDQLLSVNDKTLSEMAARAKADAGTAQTKIAELKKQIQTLTTQKASLEAANEKLRTAARKLRVDSVDRQLADVFKGIELFDQAKAKEDKANENSIKITEIEDSVQFLNSQVALLELDEAAAGKRSAAARKLADDRQKRKDNTRTQRDEFIKQLKASQQEVETLAGQIIAACNEVSAIEQRATAAYAQAEQEYEEYSNPKKATGLGTRPPAEAVVLALFGDARMAQADLRVRSLSLQGRIAKVVADVTRIFSSLPVQKNVPAIVTQVGGYLPNAAKTREEAEKKYGWAAKNYEHAAKLVDRKLRWVYRLQIAAAYAGLYRIAGDAAARQDARQNAQAALDQLQDVKNSSYVKPHEEHFRKVLASGPVLGPTSAPASP